MKYDIRRKKWRAEVSDFIGRSIPLEEEIWVSFVVDGRPSDIDPEKPSDGVPRLVEEGDEPDEAMVRKIEETISNEGEEQNQDYQIHHSIFGVVEKCPFAQTTSG